MKTNLLTIIIVICTLRMGFCQEDDGVVALDLPIRSSLVFNRYAINPTFTFVRQQNKFISINNKREWVQFDNAPETFLGSFSGRFAENIGAGLAVYQQNYGVLTTFGGLLNFAYNVKLNIDSNLTFGLNVGAYTSGVNQSNVVTNFDDPSLQNAQSNFLVTVNPGINYGTEFLDFGVSVNNLVLYNVETSTLIEDNPKQGIQAHIMHTGFISGRGFFDDSKFSAILKSEFRPEETIISGLAMLNVPKGLWLQVGYNNVYGMSGGLGLNITPQIALEYNIEKSIGELVEFGTSHDITLAYRFIAKKEYNYSGDEEVSGLFTKKRKRKPVTEVSEAELEGIRARAADRRAQAKLELEAEAEAKLKAKMQAKLDAAEKTKKEAEEKARLLEERKVKADAAVLAKIEEDKRAKERAETRARLLAEQKAKKAEEEKAKAMAEAKLLAEQKVQQEADAKRKAEEAKIAEQQKAIEDAQQQAQLLAEKEAKEKAELEARQLEMQNAKEATEARLKAEAKAKRIAKQQAIEATERQAKLLAEQKAQEEQNAIEEAERKAEDAKAEAIQLAKIKAKAEADEKAKVIAIEKAKEEAATKLQAEKKAKEELITKPQDDLAKSLLDLTKQTENSEAEQKELLEKFDNIINIKDKDLKDLKEENDLSDQGITVQPRAFKSINAENNALKAIKVDLDNVIESRNKEIEELQSLYDQRTRIKNTELDEVNLYYKTKIKRLTSEQLKATQTRTQLDVRLEAIRVATEFEKRRRIKRAAFDNQDDKYSQDRNMLQNIKRTTPLSTTPLKSDDFDFGEEQNDNIQILKNINNAESAYYLIIAIHSDITKRNEFITKVVASGRTNVDFFYDVNTSKYYIYYDKFEDINQANNAMKAKGNRPYNINMSLVKIEN